MWPAFKMERHDRGIPENAGSFHAFLSSHGQMERTDFWYTGRAQIQMAARIG